MALRSRPSKDAGWRLFARTVVARAYPRVIGMYREPTWLFFEIVLPLLATSAYVFVYRALRAPEAFIGFVILGGAMSAYWMNVLWAMANQLYGEKQSGNLPLYIMAPNSLMAVLLGMASGGVVMSTMRAVVILGVGGWLFGVRFAVSEPWLLLTVFVLALAALYGMGMMCASLFLLWGREGWHLVNLAQEPVYLASGLYFPISNFPRAVAVGASLIPLTLALDAMRQLAIPGGTSWGVFDVRLEAWLLLGLTVLFVGASYRLLGVMERLARREGRITEAHA